jgi:periplasmic divalent cation tolerance protein
MKTDIRYILVYVTCADKTEAEKIASAVLDERLAACANLIDGMEAVYWWKGKLEKGRECILIFKSENRLFERLNDKILALHSYETPCVVAFPLTLGSRAYLDWISASVTPKQAD